MKDRSIWRRAGAHLTGTDSAMRDTAAGRREGLHEARALKDYRRNDLASRRGLKKTV